MDYLIIIMHMVVAARIMQNSVFFTLCVHSYLIHTHWSFLYSVSLLNFIQSHLIYIQSTYVYLVSSYLYSVNYICIQTHLICIQLTYMYSVSSYLYSVNLYISSLILFIFSQLIQERIQRFLKEGVLYVRHHSWPAKKIFSFRWSKRAEITLETISFW